MAAWLDDYGLPIFFAFRTLVARYESNVVSVYASIVQSIKVLAVPAL